MTLRFFDYRFLISFIKPGISYQLSAALMPAISLLFVAGCVSTTDFDAMRNDINQLKRDTFELKKETSETKADLNSIRQQTSGAVKEEAFNAIRESQTSIYSQVSEISKELQILRGRFDEYKFFIDKAMKDGSIERDLLRSQFNSLEVRIKELNEKLAKFYESPQKPVEKPLAEVKEDAERAKQKESNDDDPKKAYETAYNFFKEKQYKEAREKFNAFIRKFPKDNLAANAQFWIGETYYAEKDFEGAILAYETCIKNYPGSDKVPGSLLKQGLSFIEIGDKKTAKVIFERLIEKYPVSKEADLAKKEMVKFINKPQKAQKKK